jgi:hypothetical protein
VIVEAPRRKVPHLFAFDRNEAEHLAGAQFERAAFHAGYQNFKYRSVRHCKSLVERY